MGDDEVEGILDPFGGDTIITVQPKIDGTNATIWYDNGIKAGSRKREVTLGNDNAGFAAAVSRSKEVNEFFSDPAHQGYRIYGEWLVHNHVRYEEDAYAHLYVFDVIDQFGNYVPPEEWDSLGLGLFCVPTIDQFDLKHEPDPMGRLTADMERSVYLTADGGPGEGIVIKRYGDWRSRYGNVLWAKMVRDEYRSAVHVGRRAVDVNGLEVTIAEEFITRAYCEKELDKIKATDGWNETMIPRLLGSIWHEFVSEEMWNVLKRHKNPIIDFGRLQRAVYERIKTCLAGEVF
jgi:hypothetical protein